MAENSKSNGVTIAVIGVIGTLGAAMIAKSSCNPTSNTPIQTTVTTPIDTMSNSPVGDKTTAIPQDSEKTSQNFDLVFEDNKTLEEGKRNGCSVDDDYKIMMVVGAGNNFGNYSITVIDENGNKVEYAINGDNLTNLEQSKVENFDVGNKARIKCIHCSGNKIFVVYLAVSKT